ncbi:MAG: PQQ-binding-like beta-propeller repeat protein [Candidatus Zixiibacteriota bacterium]
MAKCSKCGSVVKEGARFCTKCGTKITLISPEFTAQVDILKKRIERDSLNPKLYVELGLMFLQNNFLQEALIEFQKAVSIDSSNYDAHLRSGEIYLGLEELDKAESAYQRALSLNPTSPEAKSGLFRVYHLRKKFEQGLKLGEELVRTDPNNLEVHRALKEMYDEKGMSEEVFKELLTITTLTPSDKESLEELAGFYGEREDVENEIKCYQKVLELDPKDVVSRFNLGKSFCLRGEYQKAIEYLKNIVAEMAPPFESYGHLYLALAYISQQDLDNAIQEIGLVSPLDYEELTVSDKKLLAEAHFKIGYAIFQKKNFFSAIDYLQKAIKYDPSRVEYQQQLETAKSEQARLKSKARKKRLAITISFLAVAIIVIAGWYLSHGKIQVFITPAEDSKLYVNGKPLEGATALRPGFVISRSLFFGVRKITIEKDGYEKWEKDVRVGYGKTASIEAKLVPIYGSLKISSKPSGAEVFLDQNPLGKTPLVLKDVLATNHDLVLKKAGYSIYMSTVTIPRKDALDLYITLGKRFSRHGYDDCRQSPATTECCCFITTHVHDLGQVFPAGARLQIKYRAGTPNGHCRESEAYFYVSTSEEGGWTLLGTERVPERREDDFVHTRDYYPSQVFRFVKVNIPECYNDWSSAEAWYEFYEQSPQEETISSREQENSEKRSSGGNKELALKEESTDKLSYPKEAMFRANQEHTGVYNTKGVHEFNGLKWEFKVESAVRSSPAIAGGVVYFGSLDHHLYAVDISTGEEKWKFKTEGEVASSPAIAGGVVCFGSYDGNLYAVDVKTGEEKWRFKTGGWVVSSPVIANGVVYFGSWDSNLYAVDIETGEEKWKFGTGASIGSSPAIADGVVYFGSLDNYLYAVDINTGEGKWKFRTGDQVFSSPANADGVIYFGSRDGYLYAVDHDTGEKKWTFATGARVDSSPATADGVIYFGSWDGYLYAVNSKTGQIKWKFKTQGEVSSSPSIADGVVYFGSKDSHFYAVDIKTGEEKWKFKTEDQVTESPAIANGVVYFGSWDDHLYAAW